MKGRLWLVLCVAPLLGCGDGGDLGFGCPGADPPPPDVGGAWTVSSAQIGPSNCSQSFNDEILALIAGPTGTCTYDVDQSDTSALVTDCQGASVQGCVGSDGVISGTLSQSTTSSGCTLRSSTRLTARAGSSPSTATFQLSITFSGSNCGVLTDCDATVNSSWSR